MRTVAGVVAIILGVAACGDDPSCEAVARHVEDLARAEAGASGLKVADHALMVRNCEAERGGNARFRRCVMKATTLAAAKGCELAGIR